MFFPAQIEFWLSLCVKLGKKERFRFVINNRNTPLCLNELIIELTDISPQEFFGQQNENIELLKKYFPKLKIVARRSEEHTSELQSRENLVCRLLLEKKKENNHNKN